MQLGFYFEAYIYIFAALNNALSRDEDNAYNVMPSASKIFALDETKLNQIVHT